MTPTRRTDPHAEWDELAAGFALHALEPEEEQRFRAHLLSCARCERQVDEHAHVAAQLGSLAHDDDVRAPSWNAIRSGIITADRPRRADQPAAVVPMRPRRVSWAPRVLGAAAALLVVAGGVSAIVLHGNGSTRSAATVAISDCAQSPGCHVVELQQSDTQRAAVLVMSGEVRVAPTAMSAAPSGHMYALWQMPRDGRPVLVAALTDMQPDRPTAPTALTLPYADTAAFAISEEPANEVPTKPTQVLAVGGARA